MLAGQPRWACVLALAAFSIPVVCAQVAVRGRVVDENGTAVPGARVELRGNGFAAVTVSEGGGGFRLEVPRPGEYVVQAGARGFFALEGTAVQLAAGSNRVTVALNRIRENVESLDVVASLEPVERTETAERRQLDSVDILTVPYPAPHDFRSSLPLFQGVLADNGGRLHFNGGAADQAALTLDGFNIADPATGTFEARLSIDAVRSLDLENSRFSAEKGAGSTASLDLKTGMGDDRFRFSGTNFFPGITTQRGILVNKWTPRVSVSGPLSRGRAWFHTAFDTFYDVDLVRELPPGEDRSRGLTTGNLTRFQVNVAPGQILVGSFLVNYFDSTRAGLSFLDPAETTTNRRRTFFMSSLRHQVYFGGGALLEAGFADGRGLRRESPYGTETYEISPQGRRGNYFVDLTQRTERQQWTAHAFLPPVEARGAHQLKLGLDVQRSVLEQSAARHAYEVLRADGSLARRVVFRGQRAFGKADLTPALFVQDRWSPREDAVIEAGLRAEWNRIVRRTGVAPRFSAAFSPAWLKGTKVAAGWGLFYDAVRLGTIGRGEDQASVATFFSRDGAAARPVVTAFRVPGRSLRIPRARTLSLTLERALLYNFFGRATYTRRVGREGLTFAGDPALDPSSIVYALCNCRNDRYDAVDLSLRRTFAGKFEWFGGYTWSHSRSDAVVEYSLESPIYARQAPGRFEWDAPHRFLTWGWAPFPGRHLPPPLRFLLQETTLSYLAETRTGFPFSAVDEEGFLAGPPNARRFPAYFNVNLHLERRFRFAGALWGWRFGFNNLTNNGNPNVVNSNVSSSEFLTYGRGQPRAFSVRLRFLGRK
jgi:hypothetical protein